VPNGVALQPAKDLSSRATRIDFSSEVGCGAAAAGRSNPRQGPGEGAGKEGLEDHFGHDFHQLLLQLST
jgi:hypothetical protein